MQAWQSLIALSHSYTDLVLWTIALQATPSILWRPCAALAIKSDSAWLNNAGDVLQHQQCWHEPSGTSQTHQCRILLQHSTPSSALKHA